MAGYTGSHNPLLVNYFQFSLDRSPGLVYFCQTVNLPGIVFGTAEQPTTMGHPVVIPTGAFRFKDLELTFRVDENLKNWTEIYDWIRTSGNYVSDESTLRYNKKTSGASLLITNSTYAPKIRVDFKHVFPKILGDIKFGVNTQYSTEVLSTVVFAHTGYTTTVLANA